MYIEPPNSRRFSLLGVIINEEIRKVGDTSKGPLTAIIWKFEDEKYPTLYGLFAPNEEKQVRRKILNEFVLVEAMLNESKDMMQLWKNEVMPTKD